MSGYIDDALSLPKPSYDLWEERYGIWTYTAASVYGGLQAAAYFTELFGDYERSDKLGAAAEQIRQGMLTHLWDERQGRFARGLVWTEGKWEKDMTVESSLFGIWEFGVLPVEDHRVRQTIEAVRQELSVKTDIGGIARYTNDYYFQQSGDLERVPGNPWIICTLWIASYDITAASSLQELEGPRKTLEWVVRHALPGGALPEQLHPFDGSPQSVAPLTWSHATFVHCVSKYAHKYKELSAHQP